jgi:hypothetical protein
MTQWHIDWQLQFPIDVQELIFTDASTGERHRADVHMDGITIEFQHSPIKQKEVLARENFYGSFGSLIWVVNVSKWKGTEVCTKGVCPYTDEEDFHVRFFSHAHPSLSPISHLVIDYGDSSKLFVADETWNSRGRGESCLIGELICKKAFVANPLKAVLLAKEEIANRNWEREEREVQERAREKGLEEIIQKESQRRQRILLSQLVRVLCVWRYTQFLHDDKHYKARLLIQSTAEETIVTEAYWMYKKNEKVNWNDIVDSYGELSYIEASGSNLAHYWCKIISNNEITGADII